VRDVECHRKLWTRLFTRTGPTGYGTGLVARSVWAYHRHTSIRAPSFLSSALFRESCLFMDMAKISLARCRRPASVGLHRQAELWCRPSSCGIMAGDACGWIFRCCACRPDDGRPTTDVAFHQDWPSMTTARLPLCEIAGRAVRSGGHARLPPLRFHEAERTSEFRLR